MQKLKKYGAKWKHFAGLTVLLILSAKPVSAHVKWFTDGSYADRPLTIPEVVSPIFLWLLALCLVVIAFGVWLDQRIAKSSWYMQLDEWLDKRKGSAVLVMRVAAAMLLILSWQGGAILAPTVIVPSQYEWVGWFQFGLAFLLLFDKTVPIAGLGIIALWVIGAIIFHPFHMLDYFLFIGVGFYLATANGKDSRRLIGLTVLYLTVGFSLCWVALEKLIYKDWSLFLVEEHPQLAMGLNYDFFITSAAFVEFSLGFLLLVCLLQRPLAVLITAVFFLTTLVFGRVEVIGHTLIHGALIIFLLEGPGYVYNLLHKHFSNMLHRILFTTVNFVILLGVLLFAYYSLAENKYERKQNFISTKPMHMHGQIELAGYPQSELPDVRLEVEEDPMGGYNLRITTTNFTFTPEYVNTENRMYNGHAHLHINGEKVGRIYGEWYYLSALPPGTYELTVTLNSNNHDDYVIRGNPIEDSKILVVKD